MAAGLRRSQSSIISAKDIRTNAALEILERTSTGARTEDEINALLEVAAGMRFLQQLSSTELRGVCQALRCKKCDVAQTLIREGDTGSDVFMVLTGSVSMHALRSLAGKKVEMHLCDISHGAHFGELAMFQGQIHHSARYETRDSTTLLTLSKYDLDDELRESMEREVATKVLAIKTLPIFLNLPMPSLIKLAISAEIRVYCKDEKLQEQHEPAQHVQLILEGEVTLHQRCTVVMGRSAKCMDTVVGTLHSRMIVGSTGARSMGRKPCRFTAVAKTRVWVAAFPTSSFLRSLDETGTDIMHSYDANLVGDDEVIRAAQAKMNWENYRRTLVAQSRTPRSEPRFGRRAHSGGSVPVSRSPRRQPNPDTPTRLASQTSRIISTTPVHTTPSKASTSRVTRVYTPTKVLTPRLPNSTPRRRRTRVDSSGGAGDENASVLASLHLKLDGIHERRSMHAATRAIEDGQGLWEGQALSHALHDSSWDPMVRDISRKLRSDTDRRMCARATFAEPRTPRESIMDSTSQIGSELSRLSGVRDSEDGSLDASKNVNGGAGVVSGYFSEAAIGAVVIAIVIRPRAGINPHSAQWIMFISDVHSELDKRLKSLKSSTYFHRVQDSMYEYFLLGDPGDSLAHQELGDEDDGLQDAQLSTSPRELRTNHALTARDAATLTLLLRDTAIAVYSSRSAELEHAGDHLREDCHVGCSFHAGISQGTVQYRLASGRLSVPYHLSGEAKDTAQDLALVSTVQAPVPMPDSRIYADRMISQQLGNRFITSGVPTVTELLPTPVALTVCLTPHREQTATSTVFSHPALAVLSHRK